MTAAQRAKSAAFAALRKGPGAFIMPNPYDGGPALSPGSPFAEVNGLSGGGKF